MTWLTRRAAGVVFGLAVTASWVNCGGPTPPSCTYMVNSTSVSLSPNGGIGTVAVTTGTSCAWSATSNAGWLSITSGASGTGNGSVSFSAAANGSSARSAALTVASQAVTVSQGPLIPAPCAFGTSPASAGFTANGGDGTFAVSASPSDCQWTATVSVPFEESLAVRITSGSSGQGDGRVTYHVDPNPVSFSRQNGIVIAGLSGLSATATHTVTQLPGSACGGGSYTLISPSALTFTSAGGTGQIVVNTSGATCGWSVDISNATEDWVHVPSSTVVGNGTVTFTVSSASAQPNVPLPRSGPLYVYDTGGQRIFSIDISQR